MGFLHLRNAKCSKMFNRKERQISLLVILVAASSARSSSGAPWTTFTGNSKVFTRSSEPSSSSYNTLPYSSKFAVFPQSGSPKLMTAKQIDTLSNAFSGKSDKSSFMNYLPVTQKRSLFGLYNPFSPFNPFSPLAFGPYSGGPYSPFMPNYYPGTPPSYTADSYTTNGPSRRRRSYDVPVSKNLGPSPPYPSLSPISEEPEEFKSVRSASVTTMPKIAPMEYLPPFGMFGPMVDPSMFIAKKTMFLDNLFKTLATSTPPPMTTEDTPTTKATIVPPNFWLPNSITPDPMEYNNKVVDFLDKLFDSLKMNKTAPSDEVTKYNFVRSLDYDLDVQKTVAKSLDDIAAISAAKDSIVDSILSELSDLKGDMITTLDDLVNFQKASLTSTSSKKSFKTGPWSKFSPPTVDPSLPFKQRMMMIGQVFDMLTDLQKNITIAVQEAVNVKLNNIKPIYDVETPGANINMTFFDAIKSKLSNLDTYQPVINSYSSKFSRTAPQTATSFWVAYPQDNSPGTVKRQVEEDPLSKLYNEINAEETKNKMKGEFPRSVEMEMHQGYQSMPPGAVESIQAGGGSAPGHEGGGINLLIQMPMSNSRAPALENDSNNYWKDFSRNQGRRHHHNHH